MQNHPFHLVDHSPWPLTGSIGAMTFMSGTVMMLHKMNYMLVLTGTLLLFLTMIQWWCDITHEGTFQSLHTQIVINGLKASMILFIISEFFFFLSFFWGFFYSSLSPVMEIGMMWPRMKRFNPTQVPLLNTMILLCSGIKITWSHSSMLENKHSECSSSMFLTIILGIYFTLLEGYEYVEAPFSISDSVWNGSKYLYL